jgi:hypothetical protein
VGAFVLGASLAVTGCIYLTDLSGLSDGPPEAARFDNVVVDFK